MRRSLDKEEGSTPSASPTPSMKGTTITLAEVQALLGDHYPAFLAHFGITPEDLQTSTLKDLGAKYGFEVTAVREYMATLLTP